MICDQVTTREDWLHSTYAGATRSEVDHAYINACRTGEIEETKAPERQRVLRYILDNHANVTPRILTNPGPTWTFERCVEAELGEYRSYFIGIERSWSILEYSLRWMPGRNKRFTTVLPSGEDL